MRVKIGDYDQLYCPRCGEMNLHQDIVSVFNRNEEDSETGLKAIVSRSGVNIKTDQRGNPSSRRDGMIIHFWCEHCPGHILRLSIYQHKGTTYVDWMKPEIKEEDKP